MSTICTSCGVQIPPSLIIYKCRQCVHHFVCQLCEEKDHNRASIAFHTLEKIFVPNVQPINTNTSSIFTSDAYLYSLLGFCDHCFRFFDKEDIFFLCEQCPNNFSVCSHCYPLISKHHSPVHIFSKKSKAKTAADLMKNCLHINVKCDGCSKESFSGKRFRCEECQPSCDLCENCYGKEHTHHKFKYIQHPSVHYNNQQILSLRTLMLAEKNGPDWSDPLTGWTKSDAEQIMQQAKQEQKNYEKQLEETLGTVRAITLQAQLNMQQTITNLYNWQLWR